MSNLVPESCWTRLRSGLSVGVLAATALLASCGSSGAGNGASSAGPDSSSDSAIADDSGPVAPPTTAAVTTAADDDSSASDGAADATGAGSANEDGAVGSDRGEAVVIDDEVARFSGRAQESLGRSDVSRALNELASFPLDVPAPDDAHLFELSIDFAQAAGGAASGSVTQMVFAKYDSSAPIPDVAVLYRDRLIEKGYTSVGFTSAAAGDDASATLRFRVDNRTLNATQEDLSVELTSDGDLTIVTLAYTAALTGDEIPPGFANWARDLPVPDGHTQRLAQLRASLDDSDAPLVSFLAEWASGPTSEPVAVATQVLEALPVGAWEAAGDSVDSLADTTTFVPIERYGDRPVVRVNTDGSISVEALVAQADE